MQMKKDELWPGGPAFAFFENTFPPSTETAALGAFLRLGGVKKACDFGCGAGYLTLQILGRAPQIQMTALDISSDSVRATAQNAELNGYPVRTLLADWRKAPEILKRERFDLIATNPPFFEKSQPAAEGPRGRQRTESTPLSGLCEAASALLKNRGRFACVFPAGRLPELISALKETGLEPKRLRLIRKDPHSEPSAVLLEAMKQASPGLRIEPDLYTEWEDSL